MRHIIKLIALLALYVLIFPTANANHVAGINFEYKCVGQDRWVITMILWRDCQTNVPPPLNPLVNFTNSCGTSFNANLPQVQVADYQVSDICMSLLNQTTCNGGIYPGMEMYIYEDTIQFPASCDGEISATAVGGAGGFNYAWPNGKIGPVQDELCAGRYIVTVTDNNGCTKTDTVAIYDPSGLDLTTTTTPISCNGQCDGSITVNATGGTAPYTYSWNNGSSLPTQSNLCPGQYSVTVMDDNGNQFREYITIDNPSPIFITFTTLDETCGCDGMVRANVTGGTAPYTYTWTGGLNGLTNGNVCSGTYSLTITDANNCTATASTTVNPANFISPNLNVTNAISCPDACDGVLTSTPTGGVPPYTYAWSNGATSASINNLCAGTYTLTVTDAIGCSRSGAFNMLQPTPININPTLTSDTCGGSCVGAIALAATGGSGPLTYLWSNAATTPTITNLCAGVYTVTISDGTACNRIDSFAIKDSNTTALANITSPTCFGNCDAKIVVTPTYGAAPYTYAWSTGSTIDSIMNVCSGEYSLTVTDAAGCQFVEIYEITDPDTIQSNAVVSPVTCNNSCTGSIVLSPSGGNSAIYTYQWNTGATTSTLFGLCSGNYTVTITDANGCQKVESYNLANPAPLSLTININNDPLCSGKCDGEVQAVVTGGQQPYTYSWNNGSTLPYAFDLCGGNQIVTITDANGCTFIDSVNLLTPIPITTTSNVINSPTCSGTWEMGFGVCCRNASISNLQNPNGIGIYGSATFNAAFEPPKCNSSVQYFNEYSGTINGGCQRVSSLTYGCPNQLDCYAFLQIDPDGDHVEYSLVAPLTGANTTATFVPPFTATNPFPGTMNFDPQTGQLCYDIPTAGVYQFCLMAEEYDPVTGLFKGRTYRDIQLVILANCDPNVAPYPVGDSIHSFTTTTGATISDTNEISMCEGDDFCYTVTFLDSNLADTNLCLSSNVLELLVGPNANDTATIAISLVDTLVTNGDSALRISATVCWTAPPNSSGSYPIQFSASDDHCPSPTIGDFNMTVNVVGSTTVSPDVTICGAQSAQLQAYGGNQFVWRAISGDSIIVGQNFTCDSCSSPIASPTQTTQYEVTSDLVNSCKFKDTVTVTVAPDFFVTTTPDTVICTLDTIPLDADPSIPGTFSYVWSPAATLTNDSIENPSAFPNQTTTYNVTVTSEDNCIKYGSTTITITPLFPPITVSTLDSTLCDGDTAQLDVLLGNATPTTNGLSPDPCYGSTTNSPIGTGPNSNGFNSWPAPFGNQRSTAKHQMLFMATELTAAGYSAGLITGIALDVVTINGTNTYTDYTVGMGTTPNTSLGFAWLPTVQVFPPSTITLTTGWNWFNFPTPYMWDGVSNIVIETCFDNNGVATQNTSTRFTTFANLRTVYYQAFNQNACTSFAPNQGTLNRPNVNFEFCSVADTNRFNYSWLPNVFITDTSIIDPQVYPDNTITYNLIIYDTLGVCSDTAEITIVKAEIDAGNDTIVCAMDSVQLQPTITQGCSQGNASYAWTPVTGLSNPNIANPTVSVNQTTMYTLTYTDPCGCLLTDSLTIYISDPDTAILDILAPTCTLSDGEYIIHPNGGYGPYQFTIDSGATFYTDSLFTGLGQSINTIFYQDSIGCVSPVIIDTLVNPDAPVIDSVQLNHLSCFGAQDGSLEIFASNGEPVLEYSIDSGQTYTTDSAFINLNGGVYHIFVRDANGCITFPKVDTLFPVDELAIDSVHVKHLDCFNDQSGEIDIFGSGGTAPIQYSIDSGATYLPTSTFDSLSAGNYFIILKDSKDCVTTSQFQVLNEPPALNIQMALQNDTCFNACGGQASVNVTGGTPPFSYAWLTNTTPQNQIGVNSMAVDQLCAGSYLLEITDSNSCLHDTVFQITTPPPLTIDSIPYENIHCHGENNGSMTLYLSGGTLPYHYSIDGGNSYTTTYLDSIFIDQLTAGLYDVVIADSNYSCQTQSSITLTEPTPVEITVPFTSQTVCVGSCLQVAANATGGSGSNYLYHWNIPSMDSTSTQNFCPTQHPSLDTTLVVFAEDENGCVSDFASIVIGLHDSLQLGVSDSVGICPGDSTQLEVQATGGDGNGYRYTWSPASTLSDAFSANPIAFPSATTTYAVKLQDNCGTPAVTDSITVQIHPVPNVAFIADGATEGCEPFDVTLVNQSTPAQFCYWTITDHSESQGFSTDVLDLKAGTYDVHLKVVSPFGCSNSSTQPEYITVHPTPTANFEFGPQPTTLFDPNIVFKNLSSSNVVQWSWDFNGLGSSNEINPSFSFPSTDTGSYEVTLEVISDKDCTNDTTFVVKIGIDHNLYIPNTFTPNGDGLNDTFAPVGIGIDSDAYSLFIYDRWGQLIYESNSLSKPWDGTIKGSSTQAAVGSYVWKITANDYTDEHNRNEYSGFVNLIK